MVHFKEVIVYLSLFYIHWNSIIHNHKKSEFLRAGCLLQCWEELVDELLPSSVLRICVVGLVSICGGSFLVAGIVAEWCFVGKFSTASANLWETNFLTSEFRWRPCLVKWFLSSPTSTTFAFDWSFTILFSCLSNFFTSWFTQWHKSLFVLR